MDQRLLVFVTAAKYCNFSRAAEELYLSQPAVSQHIGSLEQSSGVSLFERRGRTLHLTRAGSLLYQQGQKILRLYEETDHLLHDLVGEAKGRLTIGASYTYGEYILPHVLGKFLGEYPLIEPSIMISNSRDVEDGVANGSLDLGIIESRSTNQQVRMQPFQQDVMDVVAATGHPLTKGEVTAAQLCEMTWLIREAGSGTRDMSDHFFATYVIVPHRTMEFSSTQVIKEAVESGLGISLLSRAVLQKEVTLGTIQSLRLPWPHPTREFSLIVRDSEFMTKAGSLFIARLHDTGHGIVNTNADLRTE